MKKLAIIALAACLTACVPAEGDVALRLGKPVKGLQVLVETAPSGQPGMTLRSVRFVNTGEAAVTVDAIETSRIFIEGDAVWSLQPTSTANREDWVLPVKKGFSQKNYLGMNDPDYGGGIPMISLWTGETNVSVGLAEPCLKLVS
ncbi:MAG: hypothetical protein IK052_03270, partial [Bacteroidales bacterium]|nr:hypothetical protein [Bacteroidales bacterium]